MSWRPRAKGGATRYVCDYLISWFMLIVWFHQSLKWCKLVCSLQILSVSRRVIRIELGLWWHHDLELAVAGGWPVSQDTDITTRYLEWVDILHSWWWCHSGTVYIYTYIHIPPRQCPLSNYDMLPLQPGTWGQLLCAVITYVRPHPWKNGNSGGK